MGEAVIDDEVAELTVQLYRSVGFRGLGYLEVKRDSRDGSLEWNPGRPTGRGALADRCGVDLLLGACQEAIGAPLASYGVQRPTRRAWVHLRSDLQAGAHAWRAGDVGLTGWLGSYARPLTTAVLSIWDPVPAVADVRRSLRSVVTRQRH